MSTTDTLLDLSRFTILERGRRRASHEPELVLGRSRRNFTVNSAMTHALGEPERMDVLLSDDGTRAIFRPNPGGHFRFQVGTMTAGPLVSLLAQHGKRWRATIHAGPDGPVALIQIDQPIERFEDQP